MLLLVQRSLQLRVICHMSHQWIVYVLRANSSTEAVSCDDKIDEQRRKTQHNTIELDSQCNIKSSSGSSY